MDVYGSDENGNNHNNQHKNVNIDQSQQLPVAVTNTNNNTGQQKPFALSYHRFSKVKTGPIQAVQPKHLNQSAPPEYAILQQRVHPFPYIKCAIGTALSNCEIVYCDKSKNKDNPKKFKFTPLKIEEKPSHVYYQFQGIRIHRTGLIEIDISFDLTINGIQSRHSFWLRLEVTSENLRVASLTDPKPSRSEEENTRQHKKQSAETRVVVSQPISSVAAPMHTPTVLAPIYLPMNIPTPLDIQDTPIQDVIDSRQSSVSRVKPTSQSVGVSIPAYIKGKNFVRRPSRTVLFYDENNHNKPAIIEKWKPNKLRISTPIWDTPGMVSVIVWYGIHSLPEPQIYNYLSNDEHRKIHSQRNKLLGFGESESFGTHVDTNANHQVQNANDPPNNFNNNRNNLTTPNIQTLRAFMIPLYNASLGSDVNATDVFGYTALHEVAYLGLLDCVKDLIARDATVDVMDHSGRTPLFWASLSGHIDVVQHLLNYGAAVDLTEDNGVTPLHVALLNDHWDVAETLVRGGADLTLKAHGLFTAKECSSDLVEVDQLPTQASPQRNDRSTGAKLYSRLALYYHKQHKLEVSTRAVPAEDLDASPHPPPYAIQKCNLNPFPYIKCPIGVTLSNFKIFYHRAGEEVKQAEVNIHSVYDKQYIYYQFHGIKIDLTGLITIRILFDLEMDGKQSPYFFEIPELQVQRDLSSASSSSLKQNPDNPDTAHSKEAMETTEHYFHSLEPLIQFVLDPTEFLAINSNFQELNMSQSTPINIPLEFKLFVADSLSRGHLSLEYVMNGTKNTTSFTVSHTVRLQENQDIEELQPGTLVICYDGHPAVDFVLFSKERQLLFIVASVLPYKSHSGKLEDIFSQKIYQEQTVYEYYLKKAAPYNKKWRGANKNTATLLEDTSYFYFTTKLEEQGKQTSSVCFVTAEHLNRLGEEKRTRKVRELEEYIGLDGTEEFKFEFLNQINQTFFSTKEHRLCILIVNNWEQNCTPKVSLLIEYLKMAGFTLPFDQSFVGRNTTFGNVFKTDRIIIIDPDSPLSSTENFLLQMMTAKGTKDNIIRVFFGSQNANSQKSFISFAESYHGGVFNLVHSLLYYWPKFDRKKFQNIQNMYLEKMQGKEGIETLIRTMRLSKPLDAIRFTDVVNSAKKRDQLKTWFTSDWETLGDHLGYNLRELAQFRTESSPLLAMLNEWQGTPEATAQAFLDVLGEVSHFYEFKMTFENWCQAFLTQS